MPRAVVDTSVLFAAAYRRDERHDAALPIVRGVDEGSLPEAVVLDYVLTETLNGLVTHAGHAAAENFLDRTEENARFHLDRLTDDGFAAAKALFRRYEALSFVDACIVAYMQSTGLEYLYAFDGDFDRVDAVSRVDVATNPYEPE